LSIEPGAWVSRARKGTRGGFWEARGFGGGVYARGGEGRNAKGIVEEKGVGASGNGKCNTPLALWKKKVCGFRVSVLLLMGGGFSSVPVTFLKMLL